MGGGKDAPKVPEPKPPPKREQEVSRAFSKARGNRLSRGLKGTDITGGLLSQASTAKKTLLGE